MGRVISGLLAVGQAIALALCVASAKEPGFSTASVNTAPSADNPLHDLAKIKFPDEKSQAFTDFFQSAEIGMPFDRIPKDVQSDRDEVEKWDPNRTIPVEWIWWLCADPKAKSLVSPHGIEVRGVRIKTSLDLAGFQIPFPLAAIGCVFDHEVKLEGTNLPSIEFRDCFVGSLWANHLTVDKDFQFSFCTTKDAKSENVTMGSIVQLAEAKIGGDLTCVESELSGLNIDSSIIGGTVLLKLIDEPIFFSLRGTKIGKNLDCRFSNFKREPTSLRNLVDPNARKSINAEQVKIGQNLIFFHAEIDGEISLQGAVIAEDLDCRGANFLGKNPEGVNGFPAHALTATAASIGGSVLFYDQRDEDFQAIGTLAFKEATITGTFGWIPRSPQRNVVLDLRHAKAGRLLNGSQPQLGRNHLLLDGFLFDRLDDDAPVDSASQLRWLRRQNMPGIVSQPYDQMAAAFRNMGLPDQATDILIAENWDHARAFYLSTMIDFLDFNKLLALLWYRGIGPLIGYGYRPANALWFFLFFLTVGTRVFQNANRMGIIVPTKPNADQLPNYPKFHPFIYSLETFIPLLKLGMGEYWGPSDVSDKPIFILPFALKKFTLCFLYGQLDANHRLAISPHPPSLLVRHYLWIHIICGWLVTTLLLAGLSGILKKN
jgi:hypothetical protein